MNNKINFEESMRELEALVQALESGQMSLEESFACYEKAMKLKTELNALLDEGDRRIRVLTESGEREFVEENQE